MAVTSSSDSLQLSCPSVQPVLGNLRRSFHALGQLFFFYISIDLYSSIATFSVTPLLLLWPLLQSYICGTDWSSSGNININAKGTLLQFLVFTWCLPKFSAVGRRRSVLRWSVHCFCWWHWWSSSWLSFTAHFLELLHLTLCQLLQC